MIRAIGEKEARSILKESGVIDVHCEFCGANYAFYAADIDKLFKKGVGE